MRKFCVFYSYCQTKESQKNLEFFVKNGINLNDDIFYVFLINNYNCSVKIPNQKNNIRKWISKNHTINSI